MSFIVCLAIVFDCELYESKHMPIDKIAIYWHIFLPFWQLGEVYQLGNYIPIGT